MNTNDLFAQPISIIANRDSNGYAYGSIFLDKGSSLKELSDKNYEYYQFHL